MSEADAEDGLHGLDEPLARRNARGSILNLFLHPNGSHTRYVSRLPPPSRPFNFQKTPGKWVWLPVRLWGRGWGAGGGRARSRIGPLPYKATARAERAKSVNV